MARLDPLRGVRYGDAAGDPSALLAPPYDVIDADEARALRARSPFNAVHLVLPEGEAPACYERAARRLREWLADDLLVRADHPALYVYAQTFRHRGRQLTRHGVFGALRLSAFPDGDVLPHEETHRGPKQDRLALMRATRAQLSPVFLVAPDPASRLPALVDRATQGTPLLDATPPDGPRHRLWRVVPGPLEEEIRRVVGSSPLLIADGHHRYETALELARATPEGHPARRTLACVVAASDPALLCLPTHRALSRPPSHGPGTDDSADSPSASRRAGGGATPQQRWTAFLERGFEVGEVDAGTPSEAARAAAGRSPALAVMTGDATARMLRPRPGGDAPRSPQRGDDVRADAASRAAPVVFDRLVLRRGFGLGPDDALERGLLSYHRDPAAAVEAAGPEGAAFLLPPPDVEAIWEEARRGRRMPPKSTYFWPKLPSGLLFRLLDA